MLDQSLQNTEILNQVKSRNYKQSIWTAMSHNLEVIQKLKPLKKFEIKEVTDENMLTNWLEIVETGLMGGNTLNTDVFNQLLKNPNCIFYLGFVNHKPVATSLLFISNNIGGVYLVATLPQYRKKGIGTQITNCCLVEAKNNNCKEVTLQATNLGLGVYAFLGFEIQGKINVFNIDRIEANC